MISSNKKHQAAKEAPERAQGALFGLKVLDLTRTMPGMFATAILGDFGADIIKIESPIDLEDARLRVPAHGGRSYHHLTLNRNKRSVVLDLKSDDGRNAFHRLAQIADVVVEGFRPGVTFRLGVDYGTLKKLNPALIYCSITGYGQEGKYRDAPGHDLNYVSLAGVAAMTGSSGGEAGIPGVAVGDLGGGAMSAAVGILVALQSRERTKEGQFIDVSITHGVVGWLMEPSSHVFAGEDPRFGRTRLTGLYPSYRLYRTADGKYLSVAASEKKFWVALCNHLGVLDIIPLHRAEGAEGKKAVEKLQAIFLTKDQMEWTRELLPLDVCVSPVLAPKDVFDSDLVRDRNFGSSVKSVGKPRLG